MSWFCLKMYQRPSAIHFFGSEEKWSLQRGNLLPQILESSTPRPNFPNPNLNFKLRWHKILRLAPQDYFTFGANLDLSWDWIFLDIPLGGSSLFSRWVLLDFFLLGELHVSLPGVVFQLEPPVIPMACNKIPLQSFIQLPHHLAHNLRLIRVIPGWFQQMGL